MKKDLPQTYTRQTLTKDYFGRLSVKSLGVSVVENRRCK